MQALFFNCSAISNILPGNFQRKRTDNRVHSSSLILNIEEARMQSAWLDRARTVQLYKILLSSIWFSVQFGWEEKIPPKIKGDLCVGNQDKESQYHQIILQIIIDYGLSEAHLRITVFMSSSTYTQNCSESILSLSLLRVREKSFYKRWTLAHPLGIVYDFRGTLKMISLMDYDQACNKWEKNFKARNNLLA